MLYKQNYGSPLGVLGLLADDTGLLGAWFAGQKYAFFGFEDADAAEKENAILKEAKIWLDGYFAGENPSPFPKISPNGTPFQQRVWAVLQEIPLGETRTYGQIGQQLQCKSAQAVGGAVGKNPLSIFIPCHRVVGTDGSLTGYAGGLDRKRWLLAHEEKRS